MSLVLVVNFFWDLLSDDDRHNFTNCSLTQETKFGSIFSDTHKSQLPNPLKDSIRATSHTRLKALDHGNVRALIAMVKFTSH
jgi:hypothetical protein